MKRLLGAALCMLILHGCAQQAEERLLPSGSSAYLPAPEDKFPEYVAENIRRIRQSLELVFKSQAAPFTGGYTPEQVVMMRAPYEIRPDPSCSGASVGFLFIHGLTDSPYLLKPLAASLAARHPCALLRGVLLPGHGTVPGDSLQMQQEQWQWVTQFGIDSFRGQVDALFLVGFSTGSSLSVNYVNSHREDTLVRGVIMLSPALKARNRAAALAPYLRQVRPWLSEQPDKDAAKYESFSVNAAAEFHRLTRGLSDIEPLEVPVFMALSGDDSTIDSLTALNFFCDKVAARGRRMLWYEAELTGSRLPRECEGIATVEAEQPDFRFVTYAHTSITMPADDPHYGFDATYRSCVHYPAGSDERRRCQTDNDRTVYGEHNAVAALPENTLLRRATFNPRYPEMVDEISRFIEQTLQMRQD